MKADLRIFVKDHGRNKRLRILLLRMAFWTRQLFVRINREGWPEDRRPVSLARVAPGAGKALARAF